MPGIGYVEPYKVTSIVTLRKSYASNSYVEQYQVVSIESVNKTYVRNRSCLQNVCQDQVMLTKRMPKTAHRRPNVNLFCQSVKPGVLQTQNISEIT